MLDKNNFVAKDRHVGIISEVKHMVINLAVPFFLNQQSLFLLVDHKQQIFITTHNQDQNQHIIVIQFEITSK